MIPKIDSVSNTVIIEKDVESIFDWFDQHKQTFYTLGWSYLRNRQQMEELFYQSILRVHKELSRFKSQTSFETWVTSIFIHICRELAESGNVQASEESNPQRELFDALDQLKDYEKDAMVLNLIKGISQEEGAQLLKVSLEEMKELLFAGIQSLKTKMGYESHFNGCKEYHKYYIDYLERTLERPKKIDFEKHIYHCPDCQEDLAGFQSVMLMMLTLVDRMEDLKVPFDFMDNIRERITEKEKNRQQRNKKRIRNGLIFAGIFAILFGLEYFSKAFSNPYFTWTEKDQELRAFLQQDLGEILNLEAESGGVKIRIKSVIADDVQTLVFYEIEDTEENDQYVLDAYDGVFVENDYEIMNTTVYRMYYPPDLEAAVNNEEKNVYQGKISLQPLTNENATIKLNITRLHKLIREPSDQNGFVAYGGIETETGEWKFEIPVTKQPSVSYALDGETNVEGVPIRFDKLTLAPTATIFQYGINMEQREKRLDGINFNHLEINDKKVKADRFSSSYIETTYDENWIPMQTHFEPLYGEKPKELNVQFESVHFTIDEPKTIVLDTAKEYPQTFEYAGNIISIEKVELGQPSKMVISNRENRSYESLNFQVVGENEKRIMAMEMDSQGVIVDKNGAVYNMNEPISYGEIEQPRHFITVISTELHPDTPGEKVIPKRLEIYGYNAMNYLDDVVKISLQ
ncbi:DUF4179 domain-containing protein [Neobacillus niacini]|uniref:DUF4179 domain-containing protein n=1 Tax=Neobacillus niacini TaxID=86668 RepID=UPI003983CFAB